MRFKPEARNQDRNFIISSILLPELLHFFFLIEKPLNIVFFFEYTSIKCKLTITVVDKNEAPSEAWKLFKAQRLSVLLVRDNVGLLCARTPTFAPPEVDGDAD